MLPASRCLCCGECIRRRVSQSACLPDAVVNVGRQRSVPAIAVSESETVQSNDGWRPSQNERTVRHQQPDCLPARCWVGRGTDDHSRDVGGRARSPTNTPASAPGKTTQSPWPGSKALSDISRISETFACIWIIVWACSRGAGRFIFSLDSRGAQLRADGGRLPSRPRTAHYRRFLLPQAFLSRLSACLLTVSVTSPKQKFQPSRCRQSHNYFDFWFACSPAGQLPPATAGALLIGEVSETFDNRISV